MTLFNRASRGNAYDTDYFRANTISSLTDLIKHGVDFMEKTDLQEESVKNWINYSKRVVEISTQNYDPNIHLGYLRLFLQIQYGRNFTPLQKIKTCLDYLLEVVKTLNNER